MIFKPRLTKPEKGNPYYNRKASGGYSPCIKGSPTVAGLDVLCNCVGFEVARFNEESDEKKCLFFGSMDAKSFFTVAKRNGLPTGTEPRLGACACWTGGSSKKGHVGNVEELDEKTGNCTIVSSGYKSYEFKVQKNCNAKNNYGMSSAYKFEGFVYNPHLETETTNKEKVEQAIALISESETKLASANKILEGLKW